MNPPIDTDEAFEADLAARMGAATDTVAAEGVTREGIDERIAARRASRRRRQGGLVLAAAALVLVAGIGALALGGGEPETSVRADDGGVTTAVPTTEDPTTTAPSSTAPETTAAPTTETPTTAPPPPESTTTESPPTTTAPPATEPAPTTTETPALTPGQPCTAGSDPDCVDPEADGSYQYLIGGADCMAALTDDYLCTDLDGDGHAGYPDEGEA